MATQVSSSRPCSSSTDHFPPEAKCVLASSRSKEDLLDVTASVHNHAGAVYGTGARYFVHGHHQQHGRQLHDDENEMARRSARLPMYGRRADAMDATDGCKMAQPQPIASLAAAAGSRSIAAYKSSWPY